MKTNDQANARATRLSEIVSGLGHTLGHSDAADIMSKLEGDPDWSKNPGHISKEQLIAERFLDEMLEAKSELDYAKFTKRMDTTITESFTEKRFLRAMRNLREDYGNYISRTYMGVVNGGHYSEPVEKYPGKVRHIWRGVFENEEAFITVGIYVKDGVPFVGGILFR